MNAFLSFLPASQAQHNIQYGYYKIAAGPKSKHLVEGYIRCNYIPTSTMFSMLRVPLGISKLMNEYTVTHTKQAHAELVRECQAVGMCKEMADRIDDQLHRYGIKHYKVRHLNVSGDKNIYIDISVSDINNWGPNHLLFRPKGESKRFNLCSTPYADHYSLLVSAPFNSSSVLNLTLQEIDDNFMHANAQCPSFFTGSYHNMTVHQGSSDNPRSWWDSVSDYRWPIAVVVGTGAASLFLLYKFGKSG